MRRALFALFLAAAIPLRAEIAMPTLPPEAAAPWTPGEYTPTHFPKPSVAPLGDGFVVAWFDGMDERIQLVHRDGTRATDNGTSVATLQFDGSVLYPPVVASRGDTAAVVWALSNGVFVNMVHADGTIEKAKGVSGDGLPFVAASHDGFLIVLISGKGAAGQFLDASGNPVGVKFTIDPELSYFTAVASNGSDYLVMTRTFDRVKTWLGSRSSGIARGAVFNAFQPIDLAAVWDGSQYVVAWSEMDGTHVASVGDDGSVRSAPHGAAPGAVRDVVSSGDGATIITQPPQFVRLLRGTTIPIASGAFDLPDAGAAAQNGNDVLVAGAQRLHGVVSDLASRTSPIVIAFAPISQSGPQVASGDTLSVIGWHEGSFSTGSSTVRFARFTPAGIIDIVDMPSVPFRLDASGYRIAIATIENRAVALRAIDSQGNLWPPEILVPAPASLRTFFTLGGVVIVPTGTAVVWSEATSTPTGLGPTTLHVTFERGPTVNLGTIDNDSVTATWDGKSVVVVATVNHDVVVKAVGVDGVRWTLPLRLSGATSFIAMASNRAGRTLIARSYDLAVINPDGKLLRVVRMSEQVTGSAAFGPTGFVFATFRNFLRIDGDGNLLGSESLPTTDWFGVAVAPAAIAYTRDSRLYLGSAF